MTKGLTEFRRKVLHLVHAGGATCTSPLRLHGAHHAAAVWLCEHGMLEAVGSGFAPVGAEITSRVTANIRLLVETAGVTQREIARRAWPHLSDNAALTKLGRHLRGAWPSPETITALARALGVPIARFYTEDRGPECY